jgi:hypothetical protein
LRSPTAGPWPYRPDMHLRRPQSRSVRPSPRLRRSDARNNRAGSISACSDERADRVIRADQGPEGRGQRAGRHQRVTPKSDANEIRAFIKKRHRCIWRGNDNGSLVDVALADARDKALFIITRCTVFSRSTIRLSRSAKLCIRTASLLGGARRAGFDPSGPLGRRSCRPGRRRRDVASNLRDFLAAGFGGLLDQNTERIEGAAAGIDRFGCFVQQLSRWMRSKGLNEMMVRADELACGPLAAALVPGVPGGTTDRGS